MKRVNIWKTLFFSVLTVAAFTGCSKDDSDDGGSSVMPSITVNGSNSTTVGIGYSGGQTRNVEVVSSGDWTLSITSGDGTACQASPASGKAGTTSVSFNVNGGVSKDRTFVATLTTSGKIAGYEQTVSAKIMIDQTNALYKENCGTDVEKGTDGWPDVRDYSDWVKGGLNDQSGVTYGGSSASVANSGKNFAPTEAELAVASGAPYASMNKASAKFYINDINIGSSKSFTFTFTAIQQTDYSGSSVFGPVEASTVRLGVSVDGGTEFLPATYTVDQIADGGNWYLCTSEFKLPASASPDKISIRFDNFAYPSSQSGLRLDDFKLIEGGNGSELAPAETTAVSISKITEAGELYEVKDATVVGTYQQGFVMQDETGAILAYMGYDAKDIPAEGSVVTVSGEASKYGDALQLKDVKVLSKTEGTMPSLTPTVVTADNITGMMTSPQATYVKMTGTVDVSTNDGKTYYNVKFLFNSSYTGSISYPNESLNVSSFDGKTVDVEGWFVNNGLQNGSGKYFTVVARSITENSNPASASFTTQPTAFAATDPVAQDLTFTTSNVEKVEFEITGTDAGMFTHEYTSGTTVKVSAKGNNESDAAYTATLNLKGDGVVLASVPLTQSKAVTSGSKWVKVTEAPADWSGDYLIVYEAENMIFDGSLTDLDVASNYKTVAIADNAIANSAEIEACKFTIATVTGGYSVKSASGFYIYNSGSSKNLLNTKAEYSDDMVNTISVDADEGILIKGKAAAVLRFNTASGDDRFRYYKPTSYTSQKPIALYKYTAE